MTIDNVELERVAVGPENYPNNRLPEIAFVGRSNVGKSSLINTMINRKSLARTSQTPGKTRTINFYNIENKLYFVDLPGYGYAKAPQKEINKWGEMIEEYLINREELKAIIMLVDIRHNPTKNDLIMYDWLCHYDYPIIIVGTKYDKIKRSHKQRHTNQMRKGFELTNEDILIPFSSVAGDGRKELWNVIQNTLDIKIK